jgi:hypothetical protein
MSLLGLSNEILQQIIQYVAAGWLPGHHPHNYGRLSKISKCCWRLHDIVHPYLYSALEIHDWESQKCISFIRTLTAKPQLARLVKTFYYAEIISDGSEISNLSEESKVWMRSILPDETYGTELCNEWFNDLFLGSHGFDKCRDAMAAWFLVLFSDNLEEFNFNDFKYEKPYLGSAKPYIDSVLEDAADEQWLGRSPCTLSSLKSVNVYSRESEENNRGVGFDSILPFLKLKSVEELSVGDLDIGYPSPEGWEQGGRHNDNGFKLRALTLDCSRLNEFTLPQFLWCFSSLKKFDYQVWKETDQYTRNVCIWPVLRESLFNLRGCLEELYLQSETNSSVDSDAHYSYAGVGDTFQAFGSLAEFSKLK